MERKNNSFKKAVVGGAVAISITTMAFGVMMHMVKASELSKTEYVNSEKVQNNAGVYNSNNADFKVDYKVIKDEASEKPDDKAVSMDAAAKTGIRDLKNIFGVDTKGKTVSMYYCPVGDANPRATWDGVIKYDTNTVYYFSVDAVSCEISATCRDLKLNKKADLGYDSSIERDSSEYKKLTEEVVSKYNLLSNKISSVNYLSQGYTNDNPDVQMMAVDEKGNKVQLSFSRYDKKLLQVCYSNWVKAAELFEENMKNIEPDKEIIIK